MYELNLIFTKDTNLAYLVNPEKPSLFLVGEAKK